MNNRLGKIRKNLNIWFVENCNKDSNNSIDEKSFIKAAFIYFLIVFAWITVENSLMKIFDENILPYLSNLEFNNRNTIIFSLIMLLPAYTIYKCLKNKYYIPYSTFLLLSFLVAIYAKYRIFGKYISTPNVVLNLGYTDLVVIFLTIFLLSCLLSFLYSNKKTKNSYCTFIPDLPISNPTSDILDYSESAKLLAKDLETIHVDASCSIGLIAPWGTGKTSYLNLLEYHLNKDNFIIIKFNPRHSRCSKNIQEDFFDELFSELKKYDLRFSSSFKDYLKAINIVSDNKILAFLFDVHKIWDKKSEKDKVNHGIYRLNKRILVFIEDFDRLLSDEIIEVFKLIDGNASFTNLIFITAYDKTHINGIIGKAYSNENTLFSDKFFTIEIQIPLRPYDKIYNYLIERLCEGLSIYIEDKESYQIILANHIELLKKYLTTLRDAKRFINLFIRQYKQVQGEVEFESYLLLYLIKYKHLDEYLNLYKKDYINTNIMKASNRFFLNEKLQTKSQEILEFLFSDKSKYSLRSINNEMAFNIYFHESVYDGLRIREMEGIFDITLDEAKVFIDNSFSKNKLRYLTLFFDSKNILTFDNKYKFELFLDLLLYIYCKNYEVTIPYLIITKLLYKENRNQILEKYTYSKQEYKNLISSKLMGIYPNYPYNITKGIIIGIINKDFSKEIIFTKNDVLNIAKNALDNLIDNDSQIKKIHIDLLYSCISDIHEVTLLISLDQDSCSKIKTLIEDNPSGYFENFIRLGMISTSPEYNSVACEPFWQQIFSSPQAFRELIDKQSISTFPNIELINNFWQLYENNGYKPIEYKYQGNVQQKIDNKLTNEVDKFNQLLSIEREFDKIEITRSKTPPDVDDKYYLLQYQRLLKNIDDILLYIKKTGDIKRKIQAAITSISKA